MANPRLNGILPQRKIPWSCLRRQYRN